MVIASMPVLASNTSAIITVKGTSATTAALTNTATLGFAEGNTVYGTNFATAPAYFVTAGQRTLSIGRSTAPGQVQVTWPVSGAPFTLQVNTNLANASGWQAPTNSPVVTNGLNVFSNGPPYFPMEFFRLLGP